MLLYLLQCFKDISQVILNGGISKHPISLVKHQELQIGQVLLQLELVMYQLMHEATRSRHYHMWDVLEQTGLVHHVDTAGDHCCPEVEILSSENLELLLDLVSQLSSGCQN